MVTWAEAFNLAGVPIDSEWSKPGNVYYHPKIREIPVTLPSPSATALEFSKQPPTAQATFPLLKGLKGSSQAGD